MPNGEEKWGRPQVTGWEWETPTLWDYKIRLTAHLQELIERRILTFEAAQRIEAEAYTQADTEGVSIRLPYYKEIARPSREWLQQRGAKIGEVLTEQAQQKWIAEHPEEMWEWETGRFRRAEAEQAFARQQQQRLTEREQESERIAGVERRVAERQQQQTMESRALAKEFPEWFAIMAGQAAPTGRGLTVAQSQARQAAYGAIGTARTAFGQAQTGARAEAYERLTAAGKPTEAARYGPGGYAVPWTSGVQTAYEGVKGATQAWQRAGGGGRPAPAPEEVFGAWFKPRQEELIREWKAEQYREYPQLYPRFEEAGGWGTGKSFQEWIESEPEAMGYLGWKRETEAMRRPPQMAKRWQPARR